VAVSPDGKTVAVPEAGTVHLVDLPAGRVSATLSAQGRCGGLIAFSPDGTRLAAVTEVSTIQVWNVADRTPLYRIRLGPKGSGRDTLAFSPSGKLLAAADGEAILLWDAADGRELAALRGHRGDVHALVWRPEGRLLASAGSDKTLRIWDTTTRQPERIYRGHTAPILSLAWHKDGERLVSGDAAGILKWWDAGQDTRARLVGRWSGISALTFTEDGRGVLAATERGIRGWDDQSVGATLNLHLNVARRVEYPLQYVAFSPNRRLYAGPTVEDPSAVRIWEVPSGREVATLRGHRGRVRTLAFSPDGRRLASAARNAVPGATPPKQITNELIIWTLPADGAAPGRLDLPCNVPVQCLAFGPDGRQLAAGDLVVETAALKDGRLSVWDVESGNLLRRWAAHAGTVQCVAFDATGSRLASAGRLNDQSVRLWDAAQGRLLHDLRGPVAPTCVAFSQDGTRLAAVGYDSIVLLWDCATGQDVLSLRAPGPQVSQSIATDSQVVFSPDGTRLAFNIHNGLIYAWDGRPLVVGRDLR
jgi:WD40 repeat protein